MKIVGHHNIAVETVDFFMNFMGACDSSQHDLSSRQSLLSFRLNEEQQASLTKPVTASEIKQVLWSMNGEPLGPEGFTALQSAWSVVDEDFTYVILEFFKPTKLLKVSSNFGTYD